MAAGRNASTLLITLVATIVLFVVFVAGSKVDAVDKHAYSLDFGWQIPKTGQPSGECDRAVTYKGFPLRSSRPADPADDPSGCLDSTNPFAGAMDFALCFAAAGIISAAVVSGIRN
jgi:hypothetical protein